MLRTITFLLASVALIAQAPDRPTQGPAVPRESGILNPPLSPRNASYSIDARLDPATRALTGTETITWRNITTRPADDLRFHLYWNAWKNTRSTFLREAALTAPIDRPAGDFAQMEVTSIKLLRASRGDGADAALDLTSAKRFIAPDDGNADDETVMAVPLPEPVPPGGSATIELTWIARVPRPFARTGAVGNFFFIAQWFPKLGVFEERGWNCRQFHSSTEFFSDYGVYDVRLTVPRGWTVGATGVERDTTDNADRTTTHQYYQEDVHDFAWTTSPAYVERTARFEHPALPAVALRLLLQPEHTGQADRHFNAARAALKHYGEWFGPYPYGHLTIVDPAYRSRAGGMEYPTLITAGTRLLLPREVTYSGPEEVVIHEAGHQWWYGIVGNNEFEDAWLDEGINTFATARAMDQEYPRTYHERYFFGNFVPWAFRDVWLRRETFWNRLPGYRLTAESDVLSDPAYRFDPVSGRSITYNKTALWLNTLERRLGWETLQRILQTFYSRWQFKHPKPEDFFAVANEVAGTNLDWFFDQVYRTSNVFDYGVQDLESVEEDRRFRTTVVVRRYGEAIFPVDVLVTFKDGTQVREHWDGRGRWNRYTYTGESQAVAAHVDPERVLLLDVDYTNNSKSLAPSGRSAATKWSLAWMIWLQDALLSWAFLA
jgi:aminopeptidase N